MGMSNFGANTNPPGNPGNGAGIPGIQITPPGLSADDPLDLVIDYNAKYAAEQPILFRDAVTQQLMGILIGKNKPNAILVGPAGTGKTKIVEDLARRIETKDPVLPAALANCRIYELPLSNLMAGTSFRGQLEEKINLLLEFLSDPKNDAILFIDEIHQLTESANESYQKIAQILKPALARGDIRCIGATTTQEAKTLNKDPAFNRRFSRVLVDELTADQTVQILTNVKPAFIQHYKNKILIDDALMSTVVKLADEYRPAGSHRPDNALTLLDRTAGNAIVANNQLIQQLTAQNNQALLQAVQAQPFIPITEKQLRTTAKQLMTGNALKQELSGTDELRSALTPIQGQDDILDVIVRKIFQSTLELFPKKTPMALMFAGGSGVGKTEVTKIIAKHLTNTRPIILNMTEYISPASVNRLIGSPDGYVGSDSKQELPFDCLETNPYQIILLDEFEKAHPSVQRLFMNILSEGVLKTSRGIEIDFSRAIIIATTNAGHTEKKKHLGFGSDETKTESRSETVDSLSKWFDMALLNRFSEILTFHPISKDVYKNILAEKYRKEVARIKETKPRIPVLDQIPDDKLNELTDETYLEEFGARPAERCVQDYILSQL